MGALAALSTAWWVLAPKAALLATALAAWALAALTAWVLALAARGA